MTDPRVEQVMNEVELHLNHLRQYFAEGAELTFVMRMPNVPDAHMVVSNDDLAAVAAVLLRNLKLRQAQKDPTIN